MENSVTQDGVAIVLSTRSFDPSSARPKVVVQVVHLELVGNRYKFSANDGKMQILAVSPQIGTSDIVSGKIQNLSLIRLLDYAVHYMPGKSEERFLFVKKCEIVDSTLDSDVTNESKASTGRILKGKHDFVAKSASQIINDQKRDAAPPATINMSRRVYPLVSLTPCQEIWTIKVIVTNKGNIRTYNNFRGEGCIFKVELTDEKGIQIQAIMFNAAAYKFYDRFQMGKVYYISRGSLKLANKHFMVVKNDYEMTLNVDSVVEEASEEEIFTLETKYNFVPLDELGRVNKGELIDVIGVLQSVKPTMSIKRKNNNEIINPKRDITLADETKKIAVVSLWNDQATVTGQQLLDMADSHPVVAIKHLRVGDFKGAVSLSTITGSKVMINPDSPEANKLKSWYNSIGKETTMSANSCGMSSPARISIADITSNPSLGKDQQVIFNTRAYVSFINPNQAMWYDACKTCNKKVTEAMDSGYWCDKCQKKDEECSLRYVVDMKVSDSTGEAWVCTFSDVAEKIIGCRAEELKKLKAEEGKEKEFERKLEQASGSSFLFQIGVSHQVYNNEKRQKITVRRISRLDYAAEARLLFQDISKHKTSQ